MGLLNLLFKKKKLTLEETNEINNEFINNNPQEKNDEQNMMREASSALTGGNFQEAIERYQILVENFPKKKGVYLGQIGAAYFFLQDYNMAIKYYIEASENGAEDFMMDDNIWEACEALYNHSNDRSEIEKYLKHYPSGSHTKKAKKLLQS